MLDEWNEVDIFIRIQALGKKAYFRGVFEDVANMYRHFWRQRAEDLTSAFYQHIRVLLSHYGREHWFFFNSEPMDYHKTNYNFLVASIFW